MKSIDADNINDLPGRLEAGDTFCFACHDGLRCFNLCCRNLNLFLYPHDVLQLKRALGISSEAFLDRYVDVVLREGNHFPDVLLRMAENDDKTCPYLTDAGCSVYGERPYSCRTFPMEQGRLFDADQEHAEPVRFFRPPEFCEGRHESSEWTPEEYILDQDAEVCTAMAERWAEIKALFHTDPWGVEGPYGRRAKMAFMAAYNLDAFREFIFNSSFLKRFHVKAERKRRIKSDDTALLKFGFDWIRLVIWGLPVKSIRLKS